MSALTQGTATPRGGPSTRRSVTDVVARVAMWSAFFLACVPLVWILGSTILVGGGAAHAIQGTLIQAVVTAAISVPIGVLTAIYLVEYGRGPVARLVSFMVDILTGIPSIVAALFIYALWVTTFGFQRVPFAVTLALAMLMIPTIVRSTEEMLKLVPNDYREASYALGVPKWRTIVKVVLPTAFSGIVTGILLGLARVMGETAPLIILGPYAKSISHNLFDGLMGTLPTMINQDRAESLQPAVDRVWGAALTLILLIFLLNLAGRLVSRFSTVRA